MGPVQDRTASLPPESTLQARAQARRERILNAALEVFTRRGYRDATMDEVAEAAATSKGGVYFHFPGKEALFLALLERSARLLQQRLLSVLSQTPDPVAKLDAAIDVVLRLFVEHRALARLFLVEALAGSSAVQFALAELRRQFAALIAHELRNIQAKESGGEPNALPAVKEQSAVENIELAATACFGAIYEVVTQWLLRGYPDDLQAAIPELRRLLRQMLGLSHLSKEHGA